MDKKEQAKKEYYYLIDSIIFRYCRDWEHSLETREKIFKRIIKYVKNITDMKKFKKDLDKALSLKTYKEEFSEVAKVLTNWRKKHEK